MRQWGRQYVTRTAPQGRGGAVAAARETSALAAVSMLENGGNAVDAAVAAALVAGVIEPMETTLAGSGHLLTYMPDDESATCVDFSARAPLASGPAMFRLDATPRADSGLGLSAVADDANVRGAMACAVPGTIAGLIAAHERHGMLPRQTVFAPAIAAAYDGFDADEYFVLEALSNLHWLRSDPGASAVYLADGLPPAPAHLGAASFGAATKVKQSALGHTLEQLAEAGADAFYRGAVGRDFVASVTEAGGVIAMDDLAGYEVVTSPAAAVPLRDSMVWAAPGPTGGLTELQMLRILDQWAPGELPRQSPEHVRVMAEAGWHVFADRYHWLGDEDYVAVPSVGLLSAGYARTIADLIRKEEPAPRIDTADGLPWERYADIAIHDPWSFDPQPGRRQDWPQLADTTPTMGTTHISVIDAGGMAASITHTATQHFGAKILCPRTGLLLNAGMGWFNARPGVANSIYPRKRPVSNMGAALVTRQGSARAAVGAPGGRRLIQAIAQVIWNIVEHDMSAQDAIDEPRIDTSSSTLLASTRIPRESLLQLARRGIGMAAVTEEHAPYLYELARPVVAARRSDGVMTAAIDAATRGYTVCLT